MAATCVSVHPTSAFFSDEPVYSADTGALSEVCAGEERTRASRLTNIRPSPLPLWPFLAVSLGFLVLALSCIFSRVTRVKAAASGRRLAGQDDDFWSPPSPKLEELCASLGLWAPADPHPQDGRRSPEMVEEFFQVLEGGRTPAPDVLEGAATSEDIGLIIPATTEDSGGSKREPPLDSDEESDDAQLSPSCEVSKRPRLAEKSAAALSAPPALPVPHQEPGASPSHQVEQEARASDGVLTEGDDKPSTSTAAEGAPSAAGGAAQQQFIHPYVRLPIVPPEVIPRPWTPLDRLDVFSRLFTRKDLFVELHDLLLLPSLDSDAAQRLMAAAERLASYAIVRLTVTTKRGSASHAVRDLGRRFVLLNSLHSAVRAVGLPEPPWWQAVVSVALDDVMCQPLRRGRYAWSFNVFLEQSLGDALLKYKSGDAPSDAEVVQLKRLLFCHPQSPAVFRRPEWNPWREDDLCAPRHAL